MNTGISSVAHLAEMGAVYPFAGYEWVYALIVVGFTLFFIKSQIAMDKGETHEAAAAEMTAAQPVLAAAE